MKVYLKAFLVTFSLSILFVTAFGIWKQKQNTTDSAQRLSIIDKLEKEGVTDFSFMDLQGETQAFSKLGKTPVLINFWASWCGPCLDEIPSMMKLVRHFNGRLQLLAISTDSSLEDIQVFLKSFPETKNPHVYLAWDRDRSLMRSFDVIRLPESFIFDKNGKLVKKIVGTINWYTEDSIQYIEDLTKTGL